MPIISNSRSLFIRTVISGLNRLRALLLCSFLLLVAGCEKAYFEQQGFALSDELSQSQQNLLLVMQHSPQQRLQEIQAYYQDKGEPVKWKFFALYIKSEMLLPGLSSEQRKLALEETGVELVEGMSSLAKTEQEQKIQSFFLRYAEQYNQLLLSHLAETAEGPEGEAQAKPKANIK